MPAATLMNQHDASTAAMDEPIAPSETTEGSASNPRKRKKSSRACDFCHINHQPCDNAKPRCSYCERHGKSCLYLRPQKKRGPAQGYRSALHSMRESAAAWGAALNLIPSLGPVIEGYLQKEEGKRLVRAIKDPQQQEFFIQAWQQSSVFKSFFGDEESPEATEAAEGEALFGASAAAGVVESIKADADANGAVTDSIVAARPPPPPVPQLPIPTTAADGGVHLDLHPMRITASLPPAPSLPHAAPPVSFSSYEVLPLTFDPNLESMLHRHTPSLSHSQDGTTQLHAGGMAGLGGTHTSLSDIVARDAARSSNSFSQTLGSLGFAPEETLNDFLAISYNPDPIDSTADHDGLLGSELDQKAYYELLMGRQFT